MSASTATRTVRVGAVDADRSFTLVARNRAERHGWDFQIFDAVPSVDALVALRLNVVVVDPAVADSGWIERACSELPDLPMIVCSGPSSVRERVEALRLGVDDWITKPVHPEELIARIEAVLRRHRRANPEPPAGPLLAGGLEIRADRYQVYADGRSADLTRREFEVLQLLADATGRVLEREEIYQRVWGYSMARGDRSVDVFIRKLRAKVAKVSPEWDYIHTHFGVGYRFQPQPRTQPQSA